MKTSDPCSQRIPFLCELTASYILFVTGSEMVNTNAPRNTNTQKKWFFEMVGDF